MKGWLVSAMGLWLLCYPVAAIIVALNGPTRWMDRHPFLGILAFVFWLAPLLTFAAMEHRARRKS
jgi:hypothetical protein